MQEVKIDCQEDLERLDDISFENTGVSGVN